MNGEHLASLLANLMVATQAEEAARSQYQGYSWDYAGGELIANRQAASREFTNALDVYIDRRIGIIGTVDRLTGYGNAIDALREYAEILRVMEAGDEAIDLACANDWWCQDGKRIFIDSTIARTLAAQVKLLKADLDALQDVLSRNGFVRCDIPACNCGSWHARYGLPERMEELKDALSDAGHPLCNDNGNIILNALRELIAERDTIEAEMVERCKELLRQARDYVATDSFDEEGELLTAIDDALAQKGKEPT